MNILFEIILEATLGVVMEALSQLICWLHNLWNRPAHYRLVLWLLFPAGMWVTALVYLRSNSDLVMNTSIWLFVMLSALALVVAIRVLRRIPR